MTTAGSGPKERPFGKWGDAFGIMRDMVYGKRHYLDLFEQTTLAFIFGRTRYYGKEWEFIPLRHFMSGVWSPTSGCVTSKIRISETKLLEALKGLEAKTIIEVERRVARSNRYRIRRDIEFDLGKALAYIFESQPDLVKMMAREMEANISLLDDNGLGLLADLHEVIRLHKELDEQSDSPKDGVAAPSSVRERGTPPVREHKIPILLKLPSGKPASPVRRSRLAIFPLRRKRALGG